MKKFLKLLRLLLCASFVTALAGVSLVHAAVQELPDEDLSAVTAADGISFAIHLEWNPNALTIVDLSQSSSISLTYYDHTADLSTSLVFQGFGGIADLWGLQIDARQGPASMGDYVDITLPALVAFKNFGFRALYAQSYTGQTQPASMPEPANSYGSWLLYGGGVMTGHVFIWPAK